MEKPKKYEFCKTDIKNIIFELEKADGLYANIKLYQPQAGDIL